MVVDDQVVARMAQALRPQLEPGQVGEGWSACPVLGQAEDADVAAWMWAELILAPGGDDR